MDRLQNSWPIPIQANSICHCVFLGFFHIDSWKPCFFCSIDPVGYKKNGFHFFPPLWPCFATMAI